MKRTLVEEIVTLEDCLDEIAPAIRSQLDECRRPGHVQGYVTEMLALRDSAAVAAATEASADLGAALPPWHVQLSGILRRFGLDEEILPIVTRRLHLDIDSFESGGFQGSYVEFEVVHAVLLVAEEIMEYRQRAEEREIVVVRSLPASVLKDQRRELIELSNMFDMCDTNECGVLTRNRASRFMAWVGLEPYRESNAYAVQKFLFEAEGGAEDRISFREILVVLERVRAFQRDNRREDVRSACDKYDLSKSRLGHVFIKDMNRVIMDLGMELRTPQEVGLVTRVLDEFDTDEVGNITFEVAENVIQRVIEAIISSRTFQHATSVSEGIADTV